MISDAQYQSCIAGDLAARLAVGWHTGALGKIPLDFSLPAESDKDETAAEDERQGLTIVPKQVTSALSSLAANYGSGSDSEPEGA